MRASVIVSTVLLCASFAVGATSDSQSRGKSAKKAGPQKQVARTVQPTKEPTVSVPRITRTFRLKHAAPKAIEETLCAVFERTPSKDDGVPPTCVRDERTGLLVVVARPGTMEVAEDLIRVLDIPADKTADSQTPPPLRTRFCMEIYQVKLPRERFARLDVQRLVDAASGPAEFEAGLKEYGDVKALFRTDRWVDPGRQVENSIDATIPVRGGESFGRSARLQRFEKMQSRVWLGLLWANDNSRNGVANITIKMETVVETDMRGDKDEIIHPLDQSFSLGHQGVVVSGRPVAMLSLEAQSAEAFVNAHVVRFVFERKE